MSIMLRDKACARLSSSGLRQDVVHRIVDDVDRWNRESGPEWTVDRLKSLKLEAITTWGGSPVLAPWVRRNRKGLPSGPWGQLVTASGRKERQRALNALMIYSTAVSREPTQRALAKFRTSAFEKAGVATLDLDPDIMRPPYGFDTRKAEQAAAKEFREMSLDPTSRIPTSPVRRVPVGSVALVGAGEPPDPRFPIVREAGVPASVSEQDVSLWFRAEYWSPLGIVLRNDPWFRTWANALSGTEGVLDHPTYHPTLGGERPSLHKLEQVPIGKIGWIPEPGLKSRAVANPARLLQVHLRPLQAALYAGLSGLPQDSTFDQESGVSKVREWLVAGRTVHCIDLSDATNNWPLGHTVGVLDGLIGHRSDLMDLSRAWVHASRGLWEDRDGSFRRWSCGQPLGLGPSFAAFALSHHAVVQDAQRRSGEPGSDYVLLGDDIAIVGDATAEEYRRSLRSLDVPVSDPKCISSDQLAEFAGRVITPEATYVAPKWRQVSDRSFLDLVRNLGPRALDLLEPRQRKVAAAIMPIPVEYGGLGMNPQGLPYARRIELGLAYQSVSEDQVYDLVQRRATRTTVEVRAATVVTRAPSYLEAERKRAPTRSLSAPKHESARARVERTTRSSPIRVPKGEEVPPGYAEGISTSDPRGAAPLRSYERKLKAVERETGESLPKAEKPKDPKAAREADKLRRLARQGRGGTRTPGSTRRSGPSLGG